MKAQKVLDKNRSKNILFSFILFAALSIIGCKNIAPNNTSSMKFSLGSDNSEKICRTLLENLKVTENSLVKVICNLTGDESQKLETNVKLKDLATLNLKFNDVTLDTKIGIGINIYYDNALIYSGCTKEDFVFCDSCKSINIKLSENKSKIKYVLNEGYINSDIRPEEYFINTEIKVPEPSKPGYIFVGWYTKSDFSGEKITQLGKNCFLGDVTLYAKWIVPSQAEQILTVDPQVLPDGTIKFGDYPQTVKADNVKIIDETTPTVQLNGWDCYLGDDKCYYVKVTPTPYNVAYTLSNGKEVGKAPLYFKMEPIVWKVLDNAYTDANGTNQGKLLLSEKALCQVLYYIDSKQTRTIEGKTVQPNNYKYSTVRAFLNGLDGSSWGTTDQNAGNYTGKGFINQAFLPSAREKIISLMVDNSKASTNGKTDSSWTDHEFWCENTQDKIFLLSAKEITNTEYGFNADVTAKNPARERKPTDYAIATGAKGVTAGSSNRNTWWWLRSPYYSNSPNARYVNDDGCVTLCNVSGSIECIVPALCIKN